MKALYFASVRERLGRAEETIAPPPEVATIADLVVWLQARGDEYEAAFAPGLAIRAAIDHAHARPEATIAGAREIAFFPPMTGG